MSPSTLQDAWMALGASLLEETLRSPNTTKSKGAFVSPASIAYALALALNGATPGTGTHRQLLQLLLAHGSDPEVLILDGGQEAAEELNEQMARAMRLMMMMDSGSGASTPSSGSSRSDIPEWMLGLRTGGQEPKLVLAQGLFVMEGDFKPEYVAVMQSLFKAEARRVSSAADVNAWVKDKTNGAIPELLRPGAQFKMVLANALYFRARWDLPFEARDTLPRTFTTVSGRKHEVNMMHNKFKQKAVEVLECPGVFRAVWLPYRDTDVRALVCLPDDLGARGLIAALKALSAPGGRRNQTKRPARVHLSMPKFKVDTCMSLVEVLKQLGVEDAFDRNRASFSRLSWADQRVSDVIHKSLVDVDEQGTVAAAATAVLYDVVFCLDRSPQEPPYELHCDRPFVFLIQHVTTGVPLFMGVVADGQRVSAGGSPGQ